jgi:hypothetical protein
MDAITSVGNYEELKDILPSDSSDFYYVITDLGPFLREGHYHITKPKEEEYIVPAWSTSKLLELLPNKINRDGVEYKFSLEKYDEGYIVYYNSESDFIESIGTTSLIDTLVEAIKNFIK